VNKLEPDFPADLAHLEGMSSPRRGWPWGRRDGYGCMARTRVVDGPCARPHPAAGNMHSVPD